MTSAVWLSSWEQPVFLPYAYMSSPFPNPGHEISLKKLATTHPQFPRMTLISSIISCVSFLWTVQKSQCFIIQTLSFVLEIGQKSMSGHRPQGLEKEVTCTLRMWASPEPEGCEWMALSRESSPKSSLNVTSSERLSVAICICQGPGGKQWHTRMRVIQDLLKGQFIKGWSKTNAEHKEGAETTLGWKDEEAGHSCSQRRVILHKEAGRIKTSSLILLNILEARGHKKPIDTVTPPGQRPEWRRVERGAKGRYLAYHLLVTLTVRNLILFSITEQFVFI